MRQQQWEDYLDSLPTALESPYGALEPNEAVELYEGPLQFANGSERWAGTGTVSIHWLPRPRLRFHALVEKEIGPAIPSKCQLEVPELEHSQLALITRQRQNLGGPEPARAEGRLNGSAWTKSPDAFQRVFFHVPNFHPLRGEAVRLEQRMYRGRVRLEWEGLEVTVDERPSLKGTLEQVELKGGYGFGHVGRLAHQEGNPIPVDRADLVLDALYWFFTLVRGMRCGPALAWAEPAEGNGICEQWRAIDIDPRVRSVRSWFPEVEPSCLHALFPRFMDFFVDSDQRDPLTWALHWYATANHGEARLEGSLVQAVLGLEVIASLRFDDDYDGAPAAKRLRHLLESFGVEPEIPASLTGAERIVQRIGNKSFPLDGPEVVTALRHRITHPKEEYRIELKALQEADDHGLVSQHEVRELAVWYLEICLLGLLGYQGPITNRTDLYRYSSETEPVPWADRAGD